MELSGVRGAISHSKVMAGFALDRAIKAVKNFRRDGPVDHWRRLRAQIHQDVCENGVNSSLGCFVQFYGGELLDASLLMIPLVGFLPADDSRVKATVREIENQLMTDGFVRRHVTPEHVDGLPPGEATIIACSFWYADNLILQGRRDEAADVFERLLSIRNDVDLPSEEYDPVSRRLLGNFPQAFSHVGLVNSARNLSSRQGPADDRPNG